MRIIKAIVFHFIFVGKAHRSINQSLLSELNE